MSQVAADGRAREHNRRLGTHGAAEADGDTRGDDARPRVMPFDLALLAGNGVENLGDAVADIIAHHVAHKEAREQNTDDGVQQIEPVGSRDGEVMRQQVLYLVDEPFQQQPRQCREHANDKS